MKEFGELLSIAKEELRLITPEQYTQIIVLRSENGYICHAVINNALSKEKAVEKQMIDELTDHRATLVKAIVCMWADGSVDLPSHAFRGMLCACNGDNVNAKILLQGKDGFITKTVGQTMF